MRTDRSIEDVRIAALKVVGIEVGDLIGRDKVPPYLSRAREAVAGAMHDLGDHEPSLHELALYIGRRHHSTILGQLKRYNREWPPKIRHLWEQAVVEELEATPSAAKTNRPVGARKRSSTSES